MDNKETQTAQASETALAAKPQAAVGSVWTDSKEYNRIGQMAQMISKSNLVPQSYQGKPEDCFLALQFAVRLGMEPLTVMQNLYVVKGKPSWSGQFCMALIRANPAFTNVRLVYTGTKGTDNRGAYVTAIRVSDGSVVDGTEVTIAMAKAEGWISNVKWKSMPEQMLGYRAAAFFARLHCPEALLGIQTAEEVEDVDSTRASTRARNLTDALRSGV
jgi:hypothetical protein